jgi:hypothetical protein
MNIFSIDLFHSIDRKIHALLPTALAVVVVGLAVRFFYLAFYVYPRPYIWDMDFFSIWSFAKFVFVSPVSEIYDNYKLFAFQMDLGCNYSPLLMVEQG